MRTLKTIHWVNRRKLEIRKHRAQFRTCWRRPSNDNKLDQLHIQQDRVLQILQEDVWDNVGDGRRDHRNAVYEDFTQACQTNPRFPNCIVITDETWVFKEDTETKRQITTRPPASSRPKRFACKVKDQKAVDRFLLWTEYASHIYICLKENSRLRIQRTGAEKLTEANDTNRGQLPWPCIFRRQRFNSVDFILIALKADVTATSGRTNLYDTTKWSINYVTH
jgi:hypothetical protein